MSRLQRDRAAVLVIDVQEAFAKAVPGYAEVVAAAATLARGAVAMGVPVIATEQYPRGLGPTAEPVAAALPEGVEPLEKVVFSAVASEGFDLGERDQAVVCGIEAHVCVNQTVLDLIDRGVEVHVARDGVASRSVANERVGLERMARAGAIVSSVETALFELLGTAGTEEFKVVQKLILEFAPNPSVEAPA